MNTTNVFVELLVIGLGPLVLIVLLFMLALGPEVTSNVQGLVAASPLAALVPLLAATYVLGIVADRLADRFFGGGLSRRIRDRYFESDDEYHRARRTIIVHADVMFQLRQYGRSRLRIARGWAFNLLLLAIPVNFVALSSLAVSRVLLIDLILAVLWLGTVYSWYALTNSEYEKIRGGAAFIREELESGALPRG